MEPIDYSRGRHNSNSKLAFNNLKDTIPAKYLKILELIDGERCTSEIANALFVLPHQISGRFSELKSQNRIYQVGTKKIGKSRFAVYSKINH